MSRRHLKYDLQVVVVFALLASLLVVMILRHSSPLRKTAGLKLSSEVVKPFDFSKEDALKEWEEKVFSGRVVYRVEKDSDLSYVKASSDASASALYYRIKMDAKTRRPTVSWKWRAEKFPVKKLRESLETENEDDFAARVYVIFPAVFFTNSKVLEYVWAETIPVGTIGTSHYSKNIKLMVLRSGASKDWAIEERDIYEDYKKMFGRTPEYNIGAVAFMTNAEHTRTGAEGVYDDITLGYRGGDRT